MVPLVLFVPNRICPGNTGAFEKRNLNDCQFYKCNMSQYKQMPKKGTEPLCSRVSLRYQLLTVNSEQGEGDESKEMK